jgi:DUF971 family protein
VVDAPLLELLDQGRWVRLLHPHHELPRAWAAAWLRAHCRCAFCTKDRRDNIPLLNGHAEIQVTGLEVMGSTGLRFEFSDGHSRGIFPWTYLDSLDQYAQFIALEGSPPG